MSRQEVMTVFEALTPELDQFNDDGKPKRIYVEAKEEGICFSHLTGSMMFLDDGTFYHNGPQEKNPMAHFFPAEGTVISATQLHSFLSDFILHLKRSNRVSVEEEKILKSINPLEFKDNMTFTVSAPGNYNDKGILSYYKTKDQMEAPFVSHMTVDGIKHIKQLVFELIKEEPPFWTRIYKDESITGILNGVITVYCCLISEDVFKDKVEEIIEALNESGYYTMTSKNLTLDSELIKDPDTALKVRHYSFRVSTITIKKEKENAKQD